MLRAVRNMALGAAYRLAYLARDIVWGVRRPALLGVRALVLRRGPGGDELLLIRHRAGAAPWSLPGGGVDKHERLEEAARREVFEEAGVAARVERLLGVYDAFRGEFTNYIAVFVCAAEGEARAPRELVSLHTLEVADARFFPIGELPAGLDAGSRRRVEEFVGGRAGLSEPW